MEEHNTGTNFAWQKDTWEFSVSLRKQEKSLSSPRKQLMQNNKGLRILWYIMTLMIRILSR